LFEMLKEISGSTLEAIHREDRPGDVRDSLADISKAKTILGYQPDVFTKEGLKIAFSWFKERFA